MSQFLALPAALPSELLSWILTHETYPLTLAICQPRQTFLSSLLACFNAPPPPPEADIDNPDDGTSPAPPTKHPHQILLIPTLQQLAISRHIDLLYFSSVAHLRAYLTVFPPPKAKIPPPGRDYGGNGKGKRGAGLIVLYGILELHKDTSEWSAQGLGDTLARVVEAGRRTGTRIILLEESKGVEVKNTLGVEREGDEDKREDRRKGGWKGWEERLPMLNRSVKRVGFESEGAGWSGRTVEVGRILARWFRFGKGEWEIHE